MADAGGLACNRLLMERKAWRKNKPFGFHARPETEADGCVTGAICIVRRTTAWAMRPMRVMVHLSKALPCFTASVSATPQRALRGEVQANPEVSVALSRYQLSMAVHALSRRTMNLLKWKCFIPGKQDTDWCVQCPCTSFACGYALGCQVMSVHGLQDAVQGQNLRHQVVRF